MVVDFQMLGSMVKKFRSNKEMTQAELAEIIDVSVTYISHIEKGKKHARLEILVSIAKALDVTMDCLLAGNQIKDSVLSDLEIKHFDICTSCKNNLISEITKVIQKNKCS